MFYSGKESSTPIENNIPYAYDNILCVECSLSQSMDDVLESVVT